MSAGESFGRLVAVRVFGTAEQFSINGQSSTIINYDEKYTEFRSIQETGAPGFRIKAKVTIVEATIGLAVNPINISLYNLGPDSRALLESQVGTKISAFAGYGNEAKRIASGNILWSRTHKEGANYVTEIIAGDSHFGLANGFVNLSFKGPTEYSQIAEACFSELSDVGVDVGTVILPSGQYQQGFVMNGSPMDVLSALCKKTNCRISIVANELSIIPNGQSIGLPPIEISQRTGLIGIPEVKSQGVIGAVPDDIPVAPQNNISFTTLLKPELGLFQDVTVISKFVNGHFVTGRTVHDVDSWEGPFYTHCEATLSSGKS